jgi:hypothetical protein
VVNVLGFTFLGLIGVEYRRCRMHSNLVELPTIVLIALKSGQLAMPAGILAPNRGSAFNRGLGLGPSGHRIIKVSGSLRR